MSYTNETEFLKLPQFNKDVDKVDSDDFSSAFLILDNEAKKLNEDKLDKTSTEEVVITAPSFKVHDLTVDENGVKIDGAEILTKTTNDKYSVLHNGEFIDLFEKSEGAVFTEHASSAHMGQNATSNSNPVSSPFSLVNPLVSYRNSYLKSLSFKPSSSTLKTRIGYLDNGLDYGDYTDWYFDITARAEDVGVLTEFALDGSDSRVTINTEHIDAETGLIKTLDKDNVYLLFGSPDGASFYYGGYPDGKTSGTTFKTRIGGGAILTSNLGMYLNIIKKELLPITYKVPGLEDINESIESRVSFKESMNLTDEEKNIAKTNIGVTDPIDNNPLKGKKISFLGDSITTFNGWIPSGNATFYPAQDVLTVEDTYWKKLVDGLELELVVNNSWSSSAVTRGQTGSVIDQKRYEELHTADSNPDIIFINMGTNDFRRNVDLGEYDGLTTTPLLENTYTFREGYAYMLAEISKAYPNAQIWCSTLATQDSAGSTSGYPEVNSDGVVVHEYNNAIRELATAYGARIIELSACGITSFNLTTYMGDKLHPNKAGMDLYFNQAKGQLLSNSTGAVKIGKTSVPTIDAVLYTKENRTEEEQAIARENINAVENVDNTNYSVVNNGALVDLFERYDNTEVDVVDTIFENQDALFNITSTAIAGSYYSMGVGSAKDSTAATILYTNEMLPRLRGKYLNTLSIKAKDIDTPIDIYLAVSAFDNKKILTITPDSPDYTEYKLDGTDSRIQLYSDYLDTDKNLIKLPTDGIFYISLKDDTFMYASLITDYPEGVANYDKRTGFWSSTDGYPTTQWSAVSCLGVGLTVLEFISKEGEYKVTNIQDLVNPTLKTINGIPLDVTDPLDTDIEITGTTTNPLKGKKISFLGDSITTYNGYIPAGYAVYYPAQDVQDVNDTYWMKTINELELELLVNNSWSGSRVTGTGTSTVVDGKRYEKLGTDTESPDIIVINIGTNDFSGNIELGSYIGNTEPVLNTTIFSDAYGYMLSKICELYPLAEIWCASLATRNRSGDVSFPETNTAGTIIHEYNNSIRKIATAFGCKIVDIANCGITHWNISNYMDDDLHPNKAGMDLYANQLINSLRTGITSTVAVSLDTSESSVNVVQITGTSTTDVLSQNAVDTNYMRKDINNNYSLIHNGKLIDITERDIVYDDVIVERAPDDGYLQTATSVPTLAPFYFSEMDDMRGKKIISITYIPKNNMPLNVGLINVTSFEEAETVGLSIREFDTELFTIKPSITDNNNLTKFMLDGTDPRVEINPDITLVDGLIEVPTTATIGFEKYSTTASGSFAFGGSALTNTLFFYIDATPEVALATTSLSIGFELYDGTITRGDYTVPIIQELSSGVDNAIPRVEADEKYLIKETLESITYVNLFDKNSPDLEMGVYTPTNVAADNRSPYAQYCISNFIPAKKGDIVWSSYIAWESAAYYDADKNRIGGLRLAYAHTSPDTITIGTGVISTSAGETYYPDKSEDDIAFIRINIKHSVVTEGEPVSPIDTTMIVVNTPYPPMYLEYNTPYTIDTKDIAPSLEIRPDNIPDGTIPLAKLEELPATTKTLFKGKSILFTGDSITQGAITGNSFIDYISEWTDFDNIYNDGKSGTGIASSFSGVPGILDRYSTWETDYGQFDYIVINGNMNDSKTASFLLGEFNDGAEPINSQYAACRALIEGLLTQYPLKQIVWIISTPRRNSYANDVYIGGQSYNPNLSTDYSWGITSWFEDYCTAIIEVCAHYGIPVLDLYHESGLRPWVDAYNTAMFVSADGTHPNTEGHKLMANKILPFLERTLGDNNG